MKKYLLLFSTSLLLTACGGESSEYEKAYDKDREVSEKVTSTETETAAPAENATEQKASSENNFEKGISLISYSDCLSCHNVDEKIVGPSYEAVAEKYEFNDKNVDYLAGKIITGGKGVWGQVPMTPHPDLSKEDAREMAKYILSLRKSN